jgi:hypothetical protein
MLRISRLRFAAETPYETVFERRREKGERVMEESVARALRQVLAEVVQDGTAIRLSGAFVGADRNRISVGGKTGSGDNRYKTFRRGGYLKSSRSVSRTGTFVFYVGDRYFGVLTAYVAGDRSGDYDFTSALPVAALKILAPDITSAMGSIH